MSEYEFPKTLTAVVAEQRSKFKIAAALAREIEVTPEGNPRHGQFEAASEYLKANGDIELAPKTIGDYWRVGVRFPDAAEIERTRSLSFSVFYTAAKSEEGATKLRDMLKRRKGKIKVDELRRELGQAPTRYVETERTEALSPAQKVEIAREVLEENPKAVISDPKARNAASRAITEHYNEVAETSKIQRDLNVPGSVETGEVGTYGFEADKYLRGAFDHLRAFLRLRAGFKYEVPQGQINHQLGLLDRVDKVSADIRVLLTEGNVTDEALAAFLGAE